MNYIVENAPTLLAILGSAVTLATLITALTPSTKDDEVVSVIRGILVRFSLLNK